MVPKRQKAPVLGRRLENVVDAARRKAIELGAIKAGFIHPQPLPTNGNDGRTPMGAAIDSYLDLVKHHRSPRTYLT